MKNMIFTSTTQSTQLITGPAGQLEIQVGEPIGESRSAWGIICHPHPLHGGTMHNKVVTTLAKTFQGLGVLTVRFNFRGVGQSTGEFDQGRGEVEDLLAVIDWVQQERPQQEIWLAGFSFGAYIAARVAMQLPISKLVTVAPPVEHFPLPSWPPITCPWIVVQGELDEIVPAKKVFAWAESRNPQPLILRFPQASHFFHGLLGELHTRLTVALR